MKERTVRWILVIAAGLLAAGCGGRKNNPLLTDVSQLKQENTTLTLETETLRQENKQLNQQVQTLSGLPKGKRLEELDTLSSVHIHKRTGLYDLNEDGRAETLVVYLQPLDTAQDVIKAVGQINVEVWNLDEAPADALLVEKTFAPDDIRDLWIRTIFGSYYRPPIEMGPLLTDNVQELTVKVIFTDYLSGRVLRDQTTVTP